MLRRAFASLLLLALAAPTRADEAGEVLVIHAGRVIPISGPELAPGTVVVRDGKVEAVGRRVATPPGARVLDLPDLVLMPGLVAPRSRFGLARYRRDGNHADLSAAGEVDPTRARFEPPLRAGYVLLGLVPEGSGIPGRAAAVRPGSGPTREALLVEAPGYLRVRFSSLPGDKVAFRDSLERGKALIAREEQARKAWEEKQKAAAPAAPAATPEGTAPVASPQPAAAPPPPAPAFVPPPIPPELAPFVALLRGKDAPRLLVELGKASDLVHFDEVWSRYKLAGRPAAWLFDASGAWSDLHLICEQLGKEKALVVCSPQLVLEPHTRTRRNLPLELTRAGARAALLPPGDDAAGLQRALEAASMLVRDGLARDAALAGLTRWSADVLGLEDSLGSLQAGRRADLVLLDGDPLAPGTRVVRVLLAGHEAWRRGQDEPEADEEDGDAR